VLLQPTCDIALTRPQTPDDCERILGLMQEMQRCGAPPSAIMDGVSGGVNDDSSLPPNVAAGLQDTCAQQ